MLSRPSRGGASCRSWAGAAALAVFLAVAASLAAAPLKRASSASTAPPAPAAARSAPTPNAAGTAALQGDTDAALQRLADEADRIDPSAPEAVARLRSVVRGLIEVERAQEREIAALRVDRRGRGTTAASRRRSRAPTPSSAAGAQPAAASGTPAAAAGTGDPPAAGALFAKRGLKKVHRPGCVFGERIHAEDRVFFKSLQEATAAGFEPCKICRPGE